METTIARALLCSTSRTTYAPSPASPRSPLPSPGPHPNAPQRILVVVTIDGERYTTVDITDSLENGGVIRSRILNKLGIRDTLEQARSVVYETEIGGVAIGQPLTDDILSDMCRERGDNRASLVFIIEQTPKKDFFPFRPLETLPDSASLKNVTCIPPHQPQRPTLPTDSPIPLPVRETFDASQPPAQTLNHFKPLPPLQTCAAHLGHVILEGGGNSPDLSAPLRRAVRPLPAIPTPISPLPSPGLPLSAYSYAKGSPVIVEIEHPYD